MGNSNNIPEGKNNAFTINSGTFNVKDTSTNADGKITSSLINSGFTDSSSGKSAHSGVTVKVGSGATFALESGTIENADELTKDDDVTTHQVGYAIDINGGTVNISGGKISSKGYGISDQSSTTNTISITGGEIETDGVAVRSGANDTITISGENTKISSTNYTAISASNQSSGSITISDGTITGKHGVGIDGSGSLNISGGTITANDSNIGAGVDVGVNSKGAVSITGGTITGARNGVVVQTTSTTAPETTISGGTITGTNFAGVLTSNSGSVKISGTAEVKGTSYAGVQNEGTGSVAVEGGKISGSTAGIVNIDGQTKISGGEIDSYYGTYNYGSGTTEISGGTVNGAVTTSNGSTKVSGGEVNGNVTNSGSGTTEISGNAQVMGDVTSSGTGTTSISENAQVSGAISGENVDVSESGNFVGVNGVYISTPTVTGWYDFSKEEQPAWGYIKHDTAKVLASLAGSNSTLTLTTKVDAITIPADFANDTVLSSITGYTTLDGSAAGATFALNITGNDNITSIVSGAGNDTLTASSVGAALNGGAGDDNLVGGSGTDTFIFTAGKDSITGYDSTDIASLAAAGLTAPTSFKNVKYDGSNLAITFAANDILTFKTASNVSIAKDTATYSYKGHSNGGMDYIALNSAEGNGISLGPDHSTVFSGTLEANENYATIDASNVNKVVRIIGNDRSNYIVSGTKGGTVSSGEGNDTITAADVAASLTLNGGAGDDLLIGGNEYNRFEYTEGTDTVRGYKTGNLVRVSGLRLAEATYSVGSGNNISLGWGGTDNLIFEGINSGAVIVQQGTGNNYYTYAQQYSAHNKSITLASGHASLYNGADIQYANYETINAAAVSTAISVMGNSLGNYIFGATTAGGSINGGEGNDKINVSDRSDDAKYLFEYTVGKDEVIGFDATKDTVDIAITDITAAKASNSNSKLALTVNKNKDVLTLRSEDEIEKVSLSDGRYLTKDGYVSGQGFSLFGSAKGQIDLNDALYKGSSINSVVADSVKSQGVTLTGGTVGGTFIYAENNKRRDGFVYGGGSATIVNYETGRDRIDLGSATLNGFEVKGNDVVLNIGDSGTISIAGAKGQEVLLHDQNIGRGYKKMVFAQTGVIENKQKNPTMATVSGAATKYSVPENGKTTIKKIYVTGLNADGASIQAGDKNNTQIDASAAGQGVSLSGGAKNDKLIGSGESDLFVYSAGKDVIQGYSGGDSISISSGLANSLSSAKITAGSKSIKFQFSNKNSLTIKANKGETLDGALAIDGKNYTYTKNAIVSGGQATLTSAFGGTFKTDDSKLAKAVTTVDGSAVSKNLTYKGTTSAESLVGGAKKTTFRGAGGDDKFVGGTGKDIFFYAKGDRGNTTIADFEFGTNGRAGNDKLKIASGTIGEITSISGGGVQFAMNSGTKNDNSNIGWFQITSGATYGTNGSTDQALTTSNVAIKANNTYYWFAPEDIKADDGSDDVLAKAGQLITSDSRVSASDVSSYNIIDLNYSTNLAKAGVAVKVTTKPTAK